MRSTRTGHEQSKLWGLARALSPDEVKVSHLERVEQDRMDRVKAQADFENDLMNDEQRWEYLSGRGIDPTRAYAEDFTNHQRRAERSRIPGYD